jgi:hypothetical protein
MTTLPPFHTLTAYGDSDWGSCKKTRNSITGSIIMLAGGAIGYKTKFQKTIAHSSTEAEWVAACDVGKMVLFFHSLLDDLGIPQHHATTLFEDNHSALFMANAQQKSNRTQNIDIKTFALIDWVEQDLLLLQDIKTSDNCSDCSVRHYDQGAGKNFVLYAYCHLNGLTILVLQHVQDTVVHHGHWRLVSCLIVALVPLSLRDVAAAGARRSGVSVVDSTYRSAT